MKTVIIVCLLFATAYAFPATSDDDSSESEIFRPLNKKVVPSVVEVDDSESDEDSFFFPGFFRPILVNPFPRFNFGGFSSLFPSSMFRFGSLFNMFGQVPDDAKVTNATSTVKVIDGQRVTVNVTTYEKDGAVFKYEVVEVVRDRPTVEGDGEREKPSVVGSEETTTRKIETDESSSPKNDNNSLDNEIFREEFHRNDWTYDEGYHPNPTTQGRDQLYSRLPAHYIDLSNDIRVNEIAKAEAINSGNFQLPADVEVFHVPRPNYPSPQSTHLVYQNLYDRPQNWHYDSRVYNYQNNRIPPFHVNNIQYHDFQPNYVNTQPFLPIRSYNYQMRFGDLF